MNATVQRVLRCGQIMGREDSISNPSSQILYLLMQAADIHHLDADIAQLGKESKYWPYQLFVAGPFPAIDQADLQSHPHRRAKLPHPVGQLDRGKTSLLLLNSFFCLPWRNFACAPLGVKALYYTVHNRVIPVQGPSEFDNQLLRTKQSPPAFLIELQMVLASLRELVGNCTLK